MVIWSFIRSFIRKERMRGRQMPVRGSMSRTGTLYHPTVLTAIPDIRVQTRTASRMVVRQRPVQPAMAATQCREIPMAATRIRQCLAAIHSREWLLLTVPTRLLQMADSIRLRQTVNFKEQFVGESFGRINKAEAELTLLTLAEYFTKIGKRRVLEERIDVGIISPYRAQVQYLKKLIKKYEFFKPYRRLISVNTVDGFQGQERDVILISLVRSNDEGQIGFLKDLRRMNVAMTRARMKLIILGNKDTMTKHPFYKKLWEYVEAINNNE